MYIPNQLVEVEKEAVEVAEEEAVVEEVAVPALGPVRVPRPKASG